jgi:AAA+ ATPase superfamily predicted ATPase
VNPFRFGQVVTGEYFTDRHREIAQISADLRSGQHLVLISPRRYGKSSLLRKVLETLELKSFWIDMEMISDEMDLANQLVRKTLSLSRWEQIRHFLKHLRIQPSLEVNPQTNSVTVAFGAGPGASATILADSLDFPETVARSMKQKLVIVFDEFQDIRRISSMLERKMRGAFQHHQQVTYVFVGSQESMIRDIFENRKNPFYKFGRQMVLDRIPMTDLRAFLIERFRRVGIDAGPLVDAILALTDGHPYYTQQLCHEVVLMKQEDPTQRLDLSDAVDRITTQHHADYGRWWGGLTQTERKVILGLASGGASPTSQEFVRKYGLQSVSTSGSAVSKLLRSGVLLKKNGSTYSIEDPFWAAWIVKHRAQ